jgi:Ca2+-transporting ATPase
MRDILEANREMAQSGLRIIASAFRELSPATPESKPPSEEMERDLVFAGMAGLQDPPRPESAEAVRRCREAGVRVVMITGDHPETARAIARELGLDGGRARALTGLDLDTLDDAALETAVRDTAIYARVSAEHKLRVVRALQAQGAVAAMTGDGVNDAPALQGADIGVAMGSGTEVAKEAADMIVADDNFASIVAAIEEGRGIYGNIRRTLQYLLAGNTGELLLMAAAILVGLPPPS